MIAESEFGARLAPLYSRTDNWRDALEPFDKVDYTERLNLKEGSKWLHAYVMKIDHTKGLLTIKYRDEKNTIFEANQWIDINGEEICKAGTHCKSAVPNFAHTPASNLTASSSNSSLYGATSTSAYSSPTRYSSYSSSGYSYNSYSTRSNTAGTPPVVGAVGLYNLGNTCFMASMLQCLSNTKRLTDVFTSDAYASQLNKSNPLGHNGKVAISYAKLIKEMWSGRFTCVVPDDFKRTIGEFQPQFAGYQQQDSQEFMLFLLDGLHEDMNRIEKKAFVEKIESNGRDDDLIAQESWRRFLLRNDSELVDSCFGQLRSHVTCSNCKYQSVTFDAYSSLSLPLPIKNTVVADVIVFPLPHGSPPVKLSFDLDVMSSIADVEKLIQEALHPSASANKKRVRGASGSGSGSGSSGVDAEYVVVKSVGAPDAASGTSDSDGVQVSKEDLDDLDDLGTESRPDDVASSGVVGMDDVEIEEQDEVDGDGVLLASPRTSQTQNPSPASSSTQGGHYHFCSAGKSKNPRIYKTYQNSASAKELGRSTYDSVIVFELEHDVPVISAYAYNAPVSPFGFVDVIMGAELKNRSYSYYGSSYGSSSSTYGTTFETIGPPHRVSYVKADTTVGEVHSVIWKIMKEYLHDDSTYRSYDPLQDTSEKCPYEIHITSTTGTTSRGVFSREMDCILNISSYDSLICVWKEDARESTHLDEDAVERVISTGAGGASGKGKSSSAVSDDDDDYAYSQQGAASKAKVNIMDCLEKFTEREQMPPEETWYCPKCKEHNAPFKKFDIWTAPDVLIIHLKRFQYTGGNFPMRDKLSELVDFPIENLDLRNYVKSPFSNSDSVAPVYDLYAVSEHMGGMGGGHYTAVAQNPENQKW
jgi:ubiquitin carboxyl-terminal hydrolase 4/11